MKKSKQVRLCSLIDAWNYQLGSIYSVRWGSKGQLLGTASDDRTAKLLDVRIEKMLYRGTTSDDGKIYY